MEMSGSSAWGGLACRAVGRRLTRATVLLGVSIAYFAAVGFHASALVFAQEGAPVAAGVPIAFTPVTRDDGANVVVLRCPACEYRRQSDMRRQCLRTRRAGTTSDSTAETTLDRCDLSVSLARDDTTTPPGPPPDPAIAAFGELDELVDQPGRPVGH